MGVAAGLLPLSRNFELQGKVGVTQLPQDAAASPWVVERGESTDLNGNIGFAFRSDCKGNASGAKAHAGGAAVTN